jgi:hypothetical protein
MSKLQSSERMKAPEWKRKAIPGAMDFLRFYARQLRALRAAGNVNGPAARFAASGITQSAYHARWNRSLGLNGNGFQR